MSRKNPLTVSMTFRNGKKYPAPNKPLSKAPALPAGCGPMGIKCRKKLRPNTRKTRPSRERAIITAIFIVSDFDV